MASNNSTEESAAGMPQLDFSTFPNQAFWLILTMLCLFMMIRLFIIPRMDNILANRRKVIEEDLVGAEKFRESAEQLGKSITEEIDQARIRANDIIAKGKEKISVNRQNGLAEAAEITSTLVENSEKIIKKMDKDAEKQIEKISLEIAPQIIAKLSSKN